MPEPTWRDVLAYVVDRLYRGDWPIARWVLLFIVLTAIRTVVSIVWTRHRAHQQIATLTSIMSRWTAELGMPFHLLSAPRQLEAVGRLRQRLVGDRALVLALLVNLRVYMEDIPIDDSVLEAMDRLAAEWQDKMAPARRRRYRQSRGLEARLAPVDELDTKS